MIENQGVWRFSTLSYCCSENFNRIRTWENQGEVICAVPEEGDLGGLPLSERIPQ